MIINKLKNYVNDPENPAYNYEIGKEYELLEQHSSATGYFLRAADRTNDKNLIYDSVVSAAKCLIDHGDSFKIVLSLLDQAVNVDSHRLEAFYLRCLSYKYIGDDAAFNEAYSNFLRVKQDNVKETIYSMIDFARVIKKNVKVVDTVRHSEDQPFKDFKQKIQKEYTRAATTPSDIHEHLPVLLELAKECNHITEMGVRTGMSTRAFLMSNADLISYDIVLDQNVMSLVEEAKGSGKSAEYIKADVLEIDIEETDLLFIDTWHSYDQLKQELALHANKSRKYIAFHDTNTYGLKNEGGDTGGISQGLLPAIIEFLIDNPHWKFKKFLTNNNGLTVLERLHHDS